MKVLYLDCISGIAGDMTLAALIDLGADLSYIEEQLRALPIDPFTIHIDPVNKRGISAKKLRLHIGEHLHSPHSHEPDGGHNHHHLQHDTHNHEHNHEHEHRKASDIIRMIEESSLPKRVKQRSTAIFQTIANAEGKIHGVSPKEVHFHEVGAMDSIIDTIGVCLALEDLQIEEIYASPVPTGHGKVKMAHGLYPIPAPATAELLIGIPLAELNVAGELTTPTGAGILKALVKEFGAMPSFTIEKIGYGGGTKDFAHPNVLRALLMQKSDSDGQDSIFVVEAQLDDMTGEALGYTMDRLFEAGAVDVFYTPIYMKKNRPGTLITLLVPDSSLRRCEDVLLVETTTLGVRRTKWMRRILDRTFTTITSPYGPIRIKLAIRGDQVLHYSPEYEDVAKAANQSGIPFQEIYQLAVSMAADHIRLKE